MLLLLLALKYYPAIFPKPRSELPTTDTTNLTSFSVTNSSASYHLTRPTPASTTPALSPIREESRRPIGDTNASSPHSPIVLTSLVSPFDSVCSPSPTTLTPLPPTTVL
ncbi:hypothetical protein PF005_g1600 [Phytophthora fragariae]|uniref:RxLR effector protein n=2 Tax=Phytophthora TaxID=4783 RepID=A0A6A3FWI8_9STRA|nr:hypothetical protein PF003_g19885 [Phytophthora fragariae]KAE9026446.1 hypothetical protein PR001_g12206 [Phytophthora rubi]KAE8948821.1 hypothetical protein PF009_g1624 [Phytophthora fragariae]KAE9029535.1 hypothetical protein PF011_g1013 [Phytophthora fragariae]KAE9137637.1 hypothetical protein PF010_g1247 [Phytophthora fragariae]